MKTSACVCPLWKVRLAKMVGGTLVVQLCLAGQVGAQDVSASVRDSVNPKVRDVDLATVPGAAAITPWLEGDPVDVRADLKETEETSVGVSADLRIPSAMALRSAAPAAGVSFEGIAATGVLPPDTVGDVGPNHYIQMVNSSMVIYDKNGGGVPLAGPFDINVLWDGFGGPCESKNSGDPITRYDHLADRWLVGQFAIDGAMGNHHECIAISRTPDPVSGGWFLYAFATVDTVTNRPIFPDYPKISVWPDAYYMGTQRGFPSSGLDVWAFERQEMLAGNPARLVQFALPAPSLFLMPSDVDGPPPPPGTPNFFARQVDGQVFGGSDRVEVFAFDVDWANPAASTFAQIANLAVDPFDSKLCGGGLMGACVPQPGTAQTLETLTVWPMWRLQYRNFGGYESMVFNHTVDADGNDTAGVRWYELRRPPGGDWSIHQQATHAPNDSLHRWMGSVAQDGQGNMALGYSVSSRTEHPGIRVASRLSGDPLGTMPQNELVLVSGAGSQTHSAARWGNYSSMDVDPVDECTFWFTTEYYDATSSAGWKTNISSFQHPECGREEEEPEVFSYEYAAKIICGMQREPKDMRLAKGFYATAINIHNPNRAEALIRKKLALTYPPGEQAPGKVVPYGRDKLGYGQALETDCVDVQQRVFARGFPTPYIKGFVVVQSTQSLDVTGVYTTIEVDSNGRIGSDNDIDVEQIRERKVRDAGECPDLVVSDIGRPSVSCPTGRGSCRTTVQVTVSNVGGGGAGAFELRTVFDPRQGESVEQSIPGLGAGASTTVTVVSDPDGNCFDPDCTITATVDYEDDVRECNEDNNRSSDTTMG